jgi:hypothetical protein
MSEEDAPLLANVNVDDFEDEDVNIAVREKEDSSSLVVMSVRDIRLVQERARRREEHRRGGSGKR